MHGGLFRDLWNALRFRNMSWTLNVRLLTPAHVLTTMVIANDTRSYTQGRRQGVWLGEAKCLDVAPALKSRSAEGGPPTHFFRPEKKLSQNYHNVVGVLLSSTYMTELTTPLKKTHRGQPPSPPSPSHTWHRPPYRLNIWVACAARVSSPDRN